MPPKREKSKGPKEKEKERKERFLKDKEDKADEDKTFTVTLTFTRAARPTDDDTSFATHVLNTGFGLSKKDYWSAFTPGKGGDPDKDTLVWGFRYHATDAKAVMAALRPHIEHPDRFTVKISNIPGVQDLF